MSQLKDLGIFNYKSPIYERHEEKQNSNEYIDYAIVNIYTIYIYIYIAFYWSL